MLTLLSIMALSCELLAHTLPELEAEAIQQVELACDSRCNTQVIQVSSEAPPPRGSKASQNSAII